jgi:hypothetical protein
LVYGLCSVFPIFPINDDIVLYSSLCGMRMRQSTGVREQLSTVCALWMELRTSGGDRKPKSCTSGSSSSVSFSGVKIQLRPFLCVRSDLGKATGWPFRLVAFHQV